MEIIQDFPHRVKEVNHFYIPVSDGTRLAARMWLPDDAKQHPVPVILEALPYRKRDGTLIRDEISHPYVAGHGYACVRIDLRGCGDSQGIFEDEYAPREQKDIIDVIHWLAGRKWCTGSVGMMGISWGGFNSLQVAFENPSPLKAVISLCSSHDRFNDDIHYKGGCLLMENVGWSGYMFNLLAMPPDPVLDNDWHSKWEQRIRSVEPGGLTWLRHQTRDDYWKHGSVCQDYGRIKAATMVVTGWADAYVNNVPELLSNLSCPCRAIVGPWVHKYPHFAAPEPQMGFLQEALKWWDKWLKGKDNGIDSAPKSTLYMMEPYLPRDFYEYRKGRWVCDRDWPNDNLSEKVFYFDGSGTLNPAPGKGEAAVASPLTCGASSGEYGTWMLGPEGPLDQRRDDADSFYLNHVAKYDMNIAGRARVFLRIKSDRSCGQVAVRLNHVHPSGDVTRISYGVLNLNLRESQERVTPMVPGQWVDVTLDIDNVAYRVPKGHTLRISISSAYFPLLWPSPEFCTLGLDLEHCRLRLPLHNMSTACEASPFEKARGAEGAGIKTLAPVKYTRDITTEAATGRVTTHIIDDLGKIHYTDMGDYKIGQICEEIYSIEPHDSDSARATIRWQHAMERNGMILEFESEINFSGDQEHFFFEAFQKIKENGKEISLRKWDETIERTAV